jgi:hypothetical protein
MARKIKAFVKKNGIFATPNPKCGKLLNKSVIERIYSFYNSDVSCLMPGIKDFVSIKTSDKTRIHVQKRLVLGNLKWFELFKTTYPVEKIGFSKFAELRPKRVLAEGNGTPGKFLLSLFCHSSSNVLFFKAAVLFVQADLNFEWKLQLFINVLSFPFGIL